jgi:hypothetical protein
MEREWGKKNPPAGATILKLSKPSPRRWKKVFMRNVGKRANRGENKKIKTRLIAHLNLPLPASSLACFGSTRPATAGTKTA